jgi:tRNA (adenine57-N1/adenine58-N1)-methyltransferase
MKKPEFHFPPRLKKLKRGGPAITQPKDAGLIIGYAGVGHESRVLELGSGSGFMTVQLANVVREVVSYEKRKEFLEIARENVERSGLDNVTFKMQDVLDGLKDEERESFDLVFCDISEANRIAERAYELLGKKGCLAAHCLQSEQAKALHLECKKHFTDVFTIEGMVREYEVKEFGFRPKHFGLLYTAYLVFARK